MKKRSICDIVLVTISLLAGLTSIVLLYLGFRYRTCDQLLAEFYEARDSGTYSWTECGFDDLPEIALGLPRQVVNPDTGRKARWTGCYKYTRDHGAAIIVDAPGGEYIITEVFVPGVFVGPGGNEALWTKEVSGNLYGIAYRPDDIPRDEQTVVTDGLGSLYLSPEQQRATGSKYFESPIFSGEPIQWIPGEEIRCKHLIAIDLESKSGFLVGNGIPKTLEVYGCTTSK